MKHNKIAIIGIGNVGATTAYALMMKNIAAELFLIDINEKRCAGEVLDLSNAQEFCRTSSIICASIEDARSADIIILCAGAPQRSGETRQNLLQKNICIVREICGKLQPVKQDSIFIVVTNPVDVLTSVVQQSLNLHAQRIFGTGTWLDTLRLKRRIAQRLGLAETSIDALVLGEHGDSQFVAWSLARAGNNPINNCNLTSAELSNMAHATQQEAYEIIQAKGATYYGIAACIAKLCQAIIFNERIVVPLSTYQEKLGVCISLPVVLGEEGIIQSIDVPLSPEETTLLAASANTIKEALNTISCAKN